MKKSRKLILAVLMVLAFATAAWAFGRIYDNTTVVSLIPADVRAATYTTNDFSVRPYKGQGLLILDAEAQGSGITNIVKVQESKLYSGQTGSSTTGDADLDLNLASAGTPTLAALFTQGSTTAQIKYLDLKLKKTGTITTTKVLTAYLYSSASTTPDTLLATSGTYTANSVSTSYQWVRFTLTTPYELSASTNYWVVLDGSYTASDANYISWYVATVASGGTAATSDGATWTAVTTQDPIFRLYEYRFADNVTFSTVGNAASFQSKGIEFDGIGGYIRAVSTVAGGSSTGAYSLTLTAPN